jgi:DNA-binding transcriptional LysR family regulator
MKMELKNLRAFVEVVRQSGFTAEGKTLCATQSTVSKAVRQLEDEIGAPLIDRLAPKPRLTAIGEAVYPRALRLLAERDEAVPAD